MTAKKRNGKKTEVGKRRKNPRDLADIVGAANTAKAEYLVISGKEVAGASVTETGDVLLMVALDGPSAKDLGRSGVALRLYPTEARTIAQMLVRKAEEAEAGLPRA